MSKKIIFNFDESGNFGKRGRYFTIAGVIMEESNKPLTNVMKRAVLKTKKSFHFFKDKNEIKASEAYPCIKDYFLNKIASKDISIRYIVADLQHINQNLLDDENTLYNYLLHFLILPEAKRAGVEEIVINLDKRSIKVRSENSFQDYIKIKLNAEHNLNVQVVVNYIESHNSLSIQAADFVANAVNAYYEWGYPHYYPILKEKIVQSEKFPRSQFGTSKVVNF